jgi:hypothetical protein
MKYSIPSKNFSFESNNSFNQQQAHSIQIGFVRDGQNTITFNSNQNQKFASTSEPLLQSNKVVFFKNQPFEGEF